MRPRSLLVLSMVAALLLQGCGAGRQYFRKPIDKYTYIPAAICAVVGAGAGVGIQEARRGESTVYAFDPNTQVEERTRSKDDAKYWIGALAGAAIGAVVCGAVGHIWDPEIEEPPPPVEEMPVTSKLIVLRGLSFFDFDKSDIRPDSRPVLDEAASILRENKEVTISVEGHTDAMGSDEYNQGLSVRRAEAVFRYMVNRGVAPERMEVFGYGESRPVADNDTESGRAQNRRVELHVVNQPAPQVVEPAAAPPAAVEAAEEPLDDEDVVDTGDDDEASDGEPAYIEATDGGSDEGEDE